MHRSVDVALGSRVSSPDDDRDPFPICCGAAIAHESPGHLGIRFTHIEEPARIRLAALLVDHLRHEVGRLKAEKRVGQRLGRVSS